MTVLHVNPRYRDFLCRQGLTTPADYLRLQGVIYCGHPDRNVSHLTLGEGPDAITAFLKREHRVRWRDRLGSAWAGFGFVSKSVREWRMLQRVQQAGIGCPEPIAVGEDDKGQAFLLLRALDDATELRRLLATLQSADRRQLARQLSEMLARIHAAGIDHPDLYSKHVLVRSGPSTGRFTFHFLDWQRSRQRRALPWRRRFRDLAALDATLAPNLATPRERLLCLYAYLRRAGGIRRAARAITRLSRRLQQRRRIREMHRLPLAPGTQNLIWLDGETLCVTREFYNRLGGTTPRWLAVPGGPSGLQCETVVLPDGRQAQLTRRWSSRPLAWLWSCLRGRRLTSPELRAAGTIFRMQRLGVQMPNLLAVGQKTIRPWQVASFLLVEPVPGAVDPLAVEGRA